ncbi:MAG: cold shock domain-containing protein [Candidatus Gracilibacteria bacterium]
MTGTIKKLTDKGFGFITGEGLEKDLFFHSNSLVGITFNELKEGDTVSFETADSPKGLNAVNVQIVEA